MPHFHEAELELLGSEVAESADVIFILRNGITGKHKIKILHKITC